MVTWRPAGAIIIVLILAVTPVAGTVGHSAMSTSPVPMELSASDAAPSPPNGTDINRTGQLNHWQRQPPEVVAQSVGIVTAIVETTNVTPDRLVQLRNHSATIELIYQDSVQVRIERSMVDELRALPWVRSVRRAEQAEPSKLSEGVGAINADRLHDLGVTGENISVGIIDLGFDIHNPEISGSIAGSKSFTGDLTNDGNSAHGTGVAEIVLDVAPDAELYVTNVNTAVEFANAVDWLESKNVDVISVSLGWTRSARGGTFLASQAASEAAENGTLFVVAAGNEGDSVTRWEGDFVNTDDDRWAEFTSNGSEANVLAGGKAFTGSIDIRLSWAGWPSTNADYDLYLFDSSDTIVSRSEVNQASNGGEPFEQISGTITVADSYYVAVRIYDAPSQPVFELTTDVTSLYYNNSRGSISPPATGFNVTAVGAYQFSSDQVQGYSSRGPTLDGRGGIDISGPDAVTTSVYGTETFTGTSAAAPHVAGVAALLIADNKSFTQTELKSTLESTAVDIHADGYDYDSGYGQINASGALRVANPHLDGFSINRTTVAVNASVRVNVSVANTPAERDNTTVRLYVDGEKASTTTVTVEGQTSTAVIFNQTFTELGNHSISVGYLDPQSVSVREPANLTVSNYSVTPADPVINESVSISATVKNTGEISGNRTISFFADGATFATRDLSLAPAETAATNATTAFASAGIHTLNVSGNSPTTLTVLAPANLTVTDYNVTPAQPTVNQTVTISATVRNLGDIAGNLTVRFYRNGTAFANQTVTLAAGEERGATVTTEFATNQTYAITVNDHSPTAVNVVEQSLSPVTGDNSPTDPDGDRVYEDIDGSGDFSIVDVQTLFINRDSSTIQNNHKLFDFNGDDRFSIADVQALFTDVV